MKYAAAVVAALLGVAVSAAPARAWESSTHVGLVEQAALAARVDAWLRDLGFRGGLFEPMVVPPADAPELLAALANHSAADGFVPDLRGQQAALSWLLAGAAVADATPQWAANHFFDPITGAGWRAPGRSWTDRLRAMSTARPTLPARGVPAPDWAVSPDNPLGLTGFLDQYEKAIAAGTPGERGRHMAGALVAAGAILHVLGDLGSPSHARADFAAHVDQISASTDDVGARFERLAAIAWGRLGVPAANEVPARAHFRAFFTGAGTSTDAGLADWTAARFFSEHTLPRTVEVGRVRSDALAATLARSLRRPAPALPRRLSMVVATQPRGTTLRDATGMCLARYRKDRGALSWWLDDDCELEQAQAILPVVAGYQAALLGWLSRGQLAVTLADGQVTVRARGAALGAGTVTLFAEDGRGVRTAAGTAPITAAADGAALATLPAPAGRRAIALYRGLDDAGEPIIAFGHVELP
ncbi:MAG: hypothetical protein IPL61_00195 [Myxococcales bacterium]|nr:hypothetical protein [Myxococcales bacterium]